MTLDDARKWLTDALTLLAALEARNDVKFKDALRKAETDALAAANAYITAVNHWPFQE